MQKMKRFFIDAFLWGSILWIIGYLLGIMFFSFVKPPLLGWIIMPIGIVITLWILFKKVKKRSVTYYFFVALSWTVIAVVCDYFLLVKVFKPSDGYYKLDVYLYYILTFTLPLFAGWVQRKKTTNLSSY